MDDIVPATVGGIPAALGQEADAARGYVQRSTEPAGPPGVAGYIPRAAFTSRLSAAGIQRFYNDKFHAGKRNASKRQEG